MFAALARTMSWVPWPVRTPPGSTSGRKVSSTWSGSAVAQRDHFERLRAGELRGQRREPA